MILKRLIAFLCLALATAEYEPASNDDPAIGFDLGHSYGTAVAHFANGTFLHLGKIDGSPQYQRYRRGLVHAHWWHKYFPFGFGSLGSMVSYYVKILWFDTTIPMPADVLTEMAAALVQKSEAILGSPLPNTVSITAPYIRAWAGEMAMFHPINRARKRAGLSIPGGYEYLPQANTVMGANGRHLCPESICHFCSPLREITKECMGPWPWIFFISMTDNAIYTAIAKMGCTFFHGDTGDSSSISFPSNFHPSGRTMIKNTYSTILEAYLIAQFNEEELRRYENGVIVVAAGDAISEPNHVRAINAFTNYIRESLISHGAVERDDLVELLFSEDPVYAAARGAALWQRTKMERLYPEWDEYDMIWDNEWEYAYVEL